MKKIVLIEDNQDIRETTQEILELANYIVFPAENGVEGVKVVKQELPDLVICDVMMPELDGYGVLRILSKLPETSNIPFIFLTAKADKGDFRKGMNLGADDYMTKPFDETELLETIETRIKKSDKIKKELSEKGADVNTIFSSSGLTGLKEIAEDRRIKKYHKKEVIYREDDYANYLYQIKKGSVKCLRADDYGKELVSDVYNEGDYLGYMALLENGEYHETAVALSDTELAVIPKKDFMEVINTNRDVSANFIKILAGNIKDREERMLHLAYAPLRERVANALIYMTQKNHKQNDKDVVIDISRDDLASMVGTAKESLVRALSEFKKEDLIETDGRKIYIRNLEGLSQSSSRGLQQLHKKAI